MALVPVDGDRTVLEPGMTIAVAMMTIGAALIIPFRIPLVELMNSDPQTLAALTLIGDAVDNVPGVDKVGPKTAAKWIAEHGSLDALLG